jgi:tetratricopeptide (TPR) repeat protein
VWLGAEHRASRVLRDGLARWPHSPALQERLRDRVLKRRGPEALETVSTKMADDAPEDAILRWYAGIAAVKVAEHYRNQSRYEQALAAYQRAIDHLERAAELDAVLGSSVDQAVALALAGRARVAFQLGQDDHALQDVLASFERSPDSAGTRDGMGITPGETGQILLNRLQEAKRVDLAEALKKALDGLDPELLRPDRY